MPKHILNERAADTSAWHATLTEVVLSKFGTDASQGLTNQEALSRLKTHGRNTLPRRLPTAWWRILLRQLASPVILILVVAAGLSLMIGDESDAIFIAAVLVVNTLIGGTQEIRAERSAHNLQKLLRFSTVVLRDGETIEIDAESVVPGDVVWLESGSRVPADLRLLSSSSLRADESLLTGESVPIEKDALWIGALQTPLADQRNMLFAGSTILQGRAKGVAVATGSTSSVGRLAKELFSGPFGRPPLMIRLDRFSRMIGLWACVAAGAIAILGAVAHGHAWSEMALFGIALGVSIIPEGLPVAITVALAVASRRMAKRGVIVRRLGAVEGLGSCTLIATDKTGTLTCNELTVREIRLPDGASFRVTGEGFAPSGEIEALGTTVGVRARRDELRALATAAVLCNEGDLHERDGRWVWHGDPTDVAMLTMAHKLGITRTASLEQAPEKYRIPFEPERRFAASVHHDSAVRGWLRVYVKGAPERVLPMCGEYGPAIEQAHSIVHSMTHRGLRVLAVAEGSAETSLLDGAEPRGLLLRGFVGMIDPLRAGAAEAIARCGDAGIAVCMVTGDHPITALAIARELGIAGDMREVMAGADLPTDPIALGEAVRRVRVFARVAPEQKLAIVRAATAAGHFVAVTGDGINDAPALRAANIGVAMGRGGTDVARDAADLVISDDNFATIVAGVEEGRVAYGNIRKVVFVLLSTGSAEVVVATLAIMSGLPLPLLPAQLLWLNMVTNGIQDVALAFEPAEGDELKRPPRAVGERLLDRRMIERSIVSAVVMGGIGFTAFAWMLRHGWEEAEARNALLLLMVLFENFHVGNCRSETRSIFTLNPLRTPTLLIGTLAAFFVHIIAMHTPGLSTVLNTAPVSLTTWGGMVALALTVVLADESYKWVRRRKMREVSL